MARGDASVATESVASSAGCASAQTRKAPALEREPLVTAAALASFLRRIDVNGWDLRVAFHALSRGSCKDI